jgi:hypothetical protein
MACIAGLIGFNLTLGFAIFIVLPLFIVSAALWPWTERMRALIVLLVAADLAIRTGKYVRLSTGWAGADPAPLERFVRAHVPPGSDVVGPEDFYFFAVEGAGSRYLLAASASPATWTRWVPPPGPSRSRRADPADRAKAPRFLLWPATEPYEPLLERAKCSRLVTVSIFDPPPAHLERLGPLGFQGDGPIAYPRTALFRCGQ